MQQGSQTGSNRQLQNLCVDCCMPYLPSLQIPVRVLLHNENKLDEMSKILEHFMTFVPTFPKEGEITLLGYRNTGTSSYPRQSS